MDIGLIVDENVSEADLKKFEKAYAEQQNRGDASSIAKFNYAHCLIRSSKENVRSGIRLLEEMLYSPEDDASAKRDYLFYLGLAHTRLKNYDEALKFVNTLLEHEEKNNQAQNLKELINKRMKRDGLMGAAIAVGAVSVVGGLVIAGFAAMSRK